jgi:hypothetical protein
LVDRLRGLGQAPLPRQERVQFRVQVRGQERRRVRYEGRVQFRTQMRHREPALVRRDERVQAPGPGMGLERGPLRLTVRLRLPMLG